MSNALPISASLCQSVCLSVYPSVHVKHSRRDLWSSPHTLTSPTEMEDAHSVQLPLSAEDKDSAYFGVFDGHGGAQFAAYCGEHLHKEIMSDVSFSKTPFTTFYGLKLKLKL